MINTSRKTPGKGWTVSSRMSDLPTILPIVDEGRETKADYVQAKGGHKTKTSNAAITDAAYQVALARQALIQEDASHSQSLGDASEPIEIDYKWVYVPVIVTTAKLHLCRFDAGNADSGTGEIDFSKAELSEVSEIIYEYSLPKSLQIAPADIVRTLTTSALDHYTRLHIVVVQSAAFPSFLDRFYPRG